MSIVTGEWTAAQQCDAVLDWLAAHGEVAARAIVRRHGLPADLAPDVGADAWLRAHHTFQGRDAAYPGLHDERAAERYARRVLDNAAIDRARAAVNRRELAVAEVLDDDDPGRRLGPHAPADTEMGFDAVELRAVAVQLRSSVSRVAMHPRSRCPGCPPEVVAASALQMLNAIASAPAGLHGGESFSELLDDALAVSDPRSADGSAGAVSSARRQRRSRCGRCVRRMLEIAIGELEIDR